MIKTKQVRSRTKKPASKPRNKITYIVEPMPETGLVRLPTIVAFLKIAKSSWWLGVKQGRFPQPVKLGPRTTAWRAEDVRRLRDTGAVAAA